MNGVNFYTTGIARFAVHFPNGHVNCRHCHFCRHREGFDIFICRLTDEYIEKSDLNKRHRLCPIEFEEGENDG